MPTVMAQKSELEIVNTPPGAPRLARLTFRGPLDLEDTQVVFPACLVKGVGAKLCSEEAANEMRRMQSGQGQRRRADSNGVIMPGGG